jgi:sulfonate transport system substrate-binding protein
MKKRVLSILMTAVLGLTLLSGCGSSDDGSDKGYTLRTTDSSTSACYRTINLAPRIGVFDEEFADDEITVEYTTFQSGAAIVEALTAGELDIAISGDQPALTGIGNNPDLEIIAVSSRTEEGNAILVAPGSDIQSVSDLKGKKVAVYIGTAWYRMLLIMLEENGLTANDVEIISELPADGLTSLQAGEVDAVVCGEPTISTAVANGTAEVLAPATGIENLVLLLTRKEFAEKHPELITRYLETMFRTKDWIEENEDEANQKMSDLTGTSLDIVKAAVAKYDEDLLLTDTDISNLETEKEFLVEQGYITSDYDLSEQIDTTFVEEAAKNYK